MSWLEWAYNHNDTEHPKYNTLGHSVFMTFKGTLIFVVGSLLIRYWALDTFEEKVLVDMAPGIGIFLLGYLVVMIGTRYM